MILTDNSFLNGEDIDSQICDVLYNVNITINHCIQFQFKKLKELST